MTPDDPVLRAALTRLRSAPEDWSGGDPSPCVKVSTRDRDVLVAALAGRFVDDTHHCAKCGIRWTGVAGAVYCGDCHRSALAGRPEADPVCPRCKRPLSEIAERLALEREDAANRGPFAPGAGR